MNLADKLLLDNAIVDVYDDIDKVNVTPSNHGMKHIYNVVKISRKFGEILKFSSRLQEIVDVGLVFHDIGQLDGRHDHGKKSAIFAEKYLKPLNYFSDEELELLLSAIETHDECKDYTKLLNDYSWYINLFDKLDFDKSRLQDNYRERYDYNSYADIETINFSINDNCIRIDIVTIDNPLKISVEELFSKNLFSKAMFTLIKFCKHFGYGYEVYLGNEKLNLSRIDTDVILDT